MTYPNTIGRPPDGGEAILLERYSLHDRPGPGVYRCTRCRNWIISIDDQVEELPFCFECGPDTAVQYERVHTTPMHEWTEDDKA